MHRLHRLLLRHGRQPLPERQLIRRGLAQDVKNGLPKEAKVVVVGGGAVGASTAYHLAKIGAGAGVLLLEGEKLTAGTTWHSAAMLNTLRFNIIEAKLVNHTKRLVSHLEAETGVSPGYKVHGGLTVTTKADHMDQFRRELDIAGYVGNQGEMVTPEQCKELLPHLNISDLLGGIYSATDGSVDPTGLTTAYARGAVLGGAQVLEGCPVTRILVEDGKVVGVETPEGKVATSRVVLAAGAWSKQLGEGAGAAMPLFASEHAYIVSDIIPNLGVIPNLRCPDDSIYTKVQNDTLYLGAFEANPAFWEAQPGFAFGLFDLNMDSYMPYLEAIHKRLPMLDNVGHKTVICGPESFTPDSMPLFGETPEVSGLFLNCAMNSRGIQLSGGMGNEMSKLLVKGTTSLNMAGYDIKRFHNQLTNDRDWVRERTQERHVRVYWPPYPSQQPLAARNRFLSPLHTAMAERGAFFGESGGWERPQFFLPEEKDLNIEEYDWYGYGETYGSEAKLRTDYRYKQILEGEWAQFSQSDRLVNCVKKEVHNCRCDHALFDNSSFGKLVVEGEGAAEALEWICSNRVGQAVGRTVYTLMLNQAGGIEADLTITRLSADKFYLVTGAAALQHVTYWLHRHLPKEVAVRDVTKDWGVLNLQGPNSREILARLIPEVSDLPFSRAVWVELEGVEVLVVRITYVGELGFELHVPWDECGKVLASLESQVPGGKLNCAGMEAMENMAMEKGYQHWPADIQTCDNAVEAGMSWVCRLGKDFIGKGAIVAARKKEELQKQLVHLNVGPEVPVKGGEPIMLGGKEVGYVRRTGDGFSVNKVLAFGYAEGFTPTADPSKEEWGLQVSGEYVPASRHFGAIFDPQGAKIKGGGTAKKAAAI